MLLLWLYVSFSYGYMVSWINGMPKKELPRFHYLFILFAPLIFGAFCLAWIDDLSLKNKNK